MRKATKELIEQAKLKTQGNTLGYLPYRGRNYLNDRFRGEKVQKNESKEIKAANGFKKGDIIYIPELNAISIISEVREFTSKSILRKYIRYMHQFILDNGEYTIHTLAHYVDIKFVKFSDEVKKHDIDQNLYDYFIKEIYLGKKSNAAKNKELKYKSSQRAKFCKNFSLEKLILYFFINRDEFFPKNLSYRNITYLAQLKAVDFCRKINENNLDIFPDGKTLNSGKKIFPKPKNNRHYTIKEWDEKKISLKLYNFYKENQTKKLLKAAYLSHWLSKIPTTLTHPFFSKYISRKSKYLASLHQQSRVETWKEIGANINYSRDRTLENIFKVLEHTDKEFEKITLEIKTLLKNIELISTAKAIYDLRNRLKVLSPDKIDMLSKEVIKNYKSLHEQHKKEYNNGRSTLHYDLEDKLQIDDVVNYKSIFEYNEFSAYSRSILDTLGVDYYHDSSKQLNRTILRGEKSINELFNARDKYIKNSIDESIKGVKNDEKGLQTIIDGIFKMLETGKKITPYYLKKAANIRIETVENTIKGSSFRVYDKNKKQIAFLRVPKWFTSGTQQHDEDFLQTLLFVITLRAEALKKTWQIKRDIKFKSSMYLPQEDINAIKEMKWSKDFLNEIIVRLGSLMEYYESKFIDLERDAIMINFQLKKIIKDEKSN